MLYYAEVTIGKGEVPNERCLCIHIAGCPNRCADCQSPHLQRTDYGDPLLPALRNILQLYLSRISCVCYLGEGDETAGTRADLISAACAAHALGLRACLYCGRDIAAPEEWMAVFNYVKLGSYMPHRGPLTCMNTNQRLYRKRPGGWKNITEQFW